VRPVPGPALTIGVDLGGTKLLAGAVDASGTVLARERRVLAGLPLDDLLAVTVDAVEAVRSAVPDAADAPIGFGIPALIDRRSGDAVRCVHLPLDGVDFGGRIGPLVGGGVTVDNDANCAMIAEWRLGAARGASHAALLTLGTGIGGGLVLDGRLYRGALGAAAEMGHAPVDYDGPPCFGGCPGRGCLEALCSGSALARDAVALARLLPESRLGRDLAAGAPITGERVTELAQEGDPDARGLLWSLGEKLGVGLAAIAMTLNPEVLIVGGGVMAADELVLEPARAELRRRAMDPARSAGVVAAALGPDAGMIGAGLLAAGMDA
jgi:glucokinase